MRFVSFVGLFVLLAIAWLMSNNKRKIRPRVIFWGVGLQLLFAMIILSQNILSMIGMFIFLSMILLYLFAPRIAQQSGWNRQAAFTAGIVAGGAVLSGAGYFLDRLGLGWGAMAAIALLFGWGAFKKKNAFKQSTIMAFLGVGFGMIYSRNLYGKTIMQFLSEKVDAFLRLTDLGTSFLFGNLIKPEYYFPGSETWPGFGFQFAFAVLPTIIFFAAFMSILYHFGIIQKIVVGMSRFMRWTIGTSGAETLSCTSNIFVGQTEAPLLIKPFLHDLTLSEMTTVMVGGFATIAGGVLAGYIRMGIDPAHLIAASVMSAPAALVIGKMIFPETEHSKTAGDLEMPEVQQTDNVLEAASVGIIDGLKLAANVGAMLVGFIALIGLVDVILNFFDGIIDGQILGGQAVEITGTPFSPVTSQYEGIFPGSLGILFGHALRYLAFIMGVPWQDSTFVGNLLGLKLSVNEFVAYGTLGNYIATDAISHRAQIISTYALCGFANFASIGIQIGGIGALAPERRADLAKVGLRAMFGGAIASWMTATVAGMLLA